MLTSILTSDETDLAQRIAEFIRFNNIDVTATPMNVIVQEFFKIQMEVIEDAGIRALGFFELSEEI